MYGNINWKNEKQIDGPFYLSMEDVGFDMGQTKVKGLNTVLLMQQFTPFVSAPNQNIFVKKIDHVIPLENTTISLKFDNQNGRKKALPPPLKQIRRVAFSQSKTHRGIAFPQRNCWRNIWRDYQTPQVALSKVKLQGCPAVYSVSVSRSSTLSSPLSSPISD